MKRGKDEEKGKGPMFPRLHVNDTQKGGPQAPPRNKMALYEQLSIPSRRFKGGILPSSSSSKVQKQVDEFPQLLVEDNELTKKSFKVSTPNNTKFSAKKAIGKTSISSLQNKSQAANCGPFSGNPFMISYPNMGSLSFNQPARQQWLIPVLSPYEGLIYKPYYGSGLMSPAYVSTPMIGNGHNFVNYGVTPPHHQWSASHPLVPSASHGYFPSFSMPIMNSIPMVEPPNPFIQSLCNVHDAADPNMVQVKEHEVQVCTTRNRNKRKQRRTALPLFPTSPPLTTGPQPSDTEVGPT